MFTLQTSFKLLLLKACAKGVKSVSRGACEYQGGKLFRLQSLLHPRIRPLVLIFSLFPFSTSFALTFLYYSYSMFSGSNFRVWKVQCCRVFLVPIWHIFFSYSVFFSFSFAGIFKQSMGARNREGIVLSYRPARGYIGWQNWFLGIYSWAPYSSLFL